ncbi:MAG: cysteine peptidase family C39 domain-containing protein [Methanothermobacter sp.]|nr:cysteine peptidase family C39 domain-containing protein [Methanothermobacter sp.]
MSKVEMWITYFFLALALFIGFVNLAAIGLIKFPQHPHVKTDIVDGYVIHYQTTDYTRGPACLATAMAARGGNVTEPQIVEILGVKYEGYTPADLVKASKKLGYDAFLSDSPNPAPYEIIIIDDHDLGGEYYYQTSNGTQKIGHVPDVEYYYMVYGGVSPDGMAILIDPPRE